MRPRGAAGRSGASRLAIPVAGAMLAACGATPSEAPARLVEVRRGDLVVDVEVTGVLKALDSDAINPPAIPRYWDFKITRMAPEGAQVKAGQEVIAFDPSELEKRLRDFQNELAAVAEELGKSRAEAAMAALNDRLEGEQKQAEARKAVLKAEKPRDLTAGLKLRQAELDRLLAEREVELQQGKERANRQRERADLSSFSSTLRRAEASAAQMKEAIARMSVKARRPGTVVYKQNFRGEKRKIGDQVYPGDVALEVALLDKMGADGQVDEVDASKLRKGQRVSLRLEANPDVEHVGVVGDIATLVRTETPESRIKVAQVEIKLEKTDPMMRPGMRFRGRIETARLPAVLTVPVSALRVSARGAEVMRVRDGRTEPVAVTLGRRSREAAEVTAGLREGDRVALAASPGAAAKTAALSLGGGRPR